MVVDSSIRSIGRYREGEKTLAYRKGGGGWTGS